MMWLALAVHALASTISPPQDPVPDLNRVAWLSGCWELRSGARLVEEQWMRPRGGLMMGMSRTSRNDTIVEFEQIRVETRGGSLYFVASPSRQATAEFLATAITDSSVTFENPAHDFPRKIAYRRQGADSLVGTIEGPRGGQTRTISFPYRRVTCR